jgi:release factor glutamine methyltransferase
MAEVIFNGIALTTVPGVVMTPRAASERLVAESSRRIGWRAARVADVGTGSGAIAIAIAERCANVLVWATDSDPRAVALASANVERHGLADRVFVRFGDLLAPVPAPLDLIVANLPYLAAATVDEHVELREEPFAAVFAPGDGLGPYRRLIDAAADWLADDGTLLFQLERHVVVASRDELATLGHAFSDAGDAAGDVLARFAA